MTFIVKELVSRAECDHVHPLLGRGGQGAEVAGHSSALAGLQARPSLAGRTRMFDHQRPGWTFNGKGLWVTEAGRSDPSLSMVGSPNFGFRSEKRNLEA